MNGWNDTCGSLEIDGSSVVVIIATAALLATIVVMIPECDCFLSLFAFNADLRIASNAWLRLAE